MESRKRFYDDWDKEDDVRDSEPKRSKDDVITSEMEIPENCVGLVIGRAGSEIHQIAQTTGCRVVVLTAERVPGFRTAQMTGTEESIEMARNHINSLVAGSSVVQNRTTVADPRKVTIDIMIPANQCGMIIGKGGEQMKKLRSLSGCQMTLIQESNVANEAKPLRITGTPEGIQIAQQFVNGMLANDKNSVVQMPGAGIESQTTVVVNVPRTSVGAIMGRNGDTVRKLSSDTKTKIQFMTDEDPTLLERKIAILGTPGRIQLAAIKIEQLVAESREENNGAQSIFYLTVPANKCGLVIGRGGDVIKQINMESGAHCELAREEEMDSREKRFVIRGSDRQVEYAKHLIGMKVGDILPGTPFIWRDQTAQYPLLPTYPPIFPIPQPNPFGMMIQNTSTIPFAPSLQMNTEQNPLSAFCPTQVSNALEFIRKKTQSEQSQPEKVGETRGNTDYSEQWLEYYRSMGDEEGMALVRERMEKNRL